MLLLLLIQQKKKKERARESSSQRGTRTQQNADACTLRLHISLKLSKSVFLRYRLTWESEERKKNNTVSGEV